jgi:hypothetical protein
VFVCGWAPLAGHSHQTHQEVSKTRSRFHYCVPPQSTSTLAKKPLNLQRLATPMDPRTQAHKAHQRQGPGSPARRHLVSLRLRLPFHGGEALSQEKVPNFPTFLGSGELAPIGHVWPGPKVKVNPGCTGQHGSCAPEEESLNSFRSSVFEPIPHRWKSISLQTQEHLRKGHRHSTACLRICRFSGPLSLFSVSLDLHTPRQRERAHSHPVPASVGA